jgi:hypothetical protein
LLNTFVFFHIAEKVLSFSSLSPAFVFCLMLLSFLEIAKKTPHLDENVLPILFGFLEPSPTIVIMRKKTITIVGSLPLFPFLFPPFPFAGFQVSCSASIVATLASEAFGGIKLSLARRRRINSR